MTKDVAASVRARLLNLAKAQGVDFNTVLVQFALERFLYRLSQSKYAGMTCRTVQHGTLTYLDSVNQT